MNRKLYLNGASAYDLGPRCETCRFWFERLDGAKMPLPVADLSTRLAVGDVDDELIAAVGAALPL